MATDFDQIFPLRNEQEEVVLFSPARGNNYTYVEGSVWEKNPIASIWPSGATVDAGSLSTLDTAKVTRAYADGKTFVAYSSLLLDDAGVDKDGSLYFWDTSTPTPTLVLQTPTAASGGTGLVAGLPVAVLGKIEGVSSSNGYLLAYSGLTVYWAPFDGDQFNFEITAGGDSTGAGFKIPEDVKGPIKAITPVAGGFIIFTNKNAVAASYSSSNFENPWIFREIANCGGIEDSEKIAFDNAATAPPQRLIAYTTGGLQAITLNSAESLYPNASDFLGGKMMERYDSETHRSIISRTSVEFFTKLTYIGNRFLIISYGTYPGVFSWALLYDQSLQRWGKFRVVHVDCFPYLYNSETVPLTYGMLMDVPYSDLADVPYEDLEVAPTGITYPLQAVGFLLKTGEVKLAVLDHTLQDETDDSKAVVIIGRIQLSRQAQMTLLTAEIEGIQPGSTLHAVPSYNGRTLETAAPAVAIESAGDYIKFGWELVTAKNFNLVFEGDFHLTTCILEGMPDGKF